MEELKQPTRAPRRLYPLLWACVLGVGAAICIWILYLWLVPLPQQQITPETQLSEVSLPIPFTGSYLPRTPEVPPPPAPGLYRISTQDPVIFVTIDDGVYRPADAQAYIVDNKIPITSFLTTSMVRRDPGYFAAMSAGQTIANHTVNHPHMPRLTYVQQKDEICTAQTQLQQWFGTRPTLFRPPYGELDLDTKRAAAYCGIKYLVNWSVVLDRGKLDYLSASKQLEPGDIVLLHYRPELKRDLEVLSAAAQARGLHFAPLPQYLGL